jgi:voltage-gated potassium channel
VSSQWVRLARALAVLLVVMIAGTVGYVAFGFGFLDALYQTVTTVTTVGFREVHPLSDGGKVFTIVLILAGVGAALYTLGVLMQVFVEGELLDLFGRRRMDRRIAEMTDHVVVCGWGRVGHALGAEVATAGTELVVIDRDEGSLADCPFPTVVGDATDDVVLEQAGVRQARALVAALDSDAGNLFVTVSARAMHPELFIVARVRVEDSIEKLRRGGADRVVNPQSIGGARMAAFVLQPHVTEFLDVVMHDRNIEFRLEEFRVAPSSPCAGRTIRESQIRDRTGALVLALRRPDGGFSTNPSPDARIEPDHVIIAIGTPVELASLGELAGGDG